MEPQDYEGFAAESGELFEMFKFGKYKFTGEKLNTWGKKVADVIDNTIDAVEAAIAEQDESSESGNSDSTDTTSSASYTDSDGHGSDHTSKNAEDQDSYDSSSQSF